MKDARRFRREASVDLFYFGDSLCILDRDKVKEREMPASFPYMCDGKFESFRLLSGGRPIQNEASGIVSR